MTSPRERPTARAHREIAAVLSEGQIAIDATAGNGHDTLFLSRTVGPSGNVLAFDIQEQALVSTRRCLEEAGAADGVRLIHASHASMAEYAAPSSVAAIVFNLGYLPGGNHQLITRTSESLAALDAARSLLIPGGILTVVCYPGHPGGDAEGDAVSAWAMGLGETWTAEVDRPDAIPRTSPFLVLVRRAAGA